MKVFGKKTLALVLTIAMALSLCSFTAFAGEEQTIIVGESVTLIKPSEAGSYPVTWSTQDTSLVELNSTTGTVKGKEAGTATVKASWTIPAVDGNTQPEQNREKSYKVTVVANTITGLVFKNNDDASRNIPYGASFSASDLSNIELEARYGENVKRPYKATWVLKSGFNDLGSTVGSTATYVPNVANVSSLPEVEVRVVQATITSVTAPSIIKVPVGTSTDMVASKVAGVKTVSVKLNSTTDKTLTIGTDLSAWANGNYNASSATATTYTYDTGLLSGSAAATNYTLASGVSFDDKLTVETKSAWDLTAIPVSAVIEGDGDSFDIETRLYSEIYSQIKALTGNTPSFTLIYSDLDLGYVSTDGKFKVNLNSSDKNDLYEKGSVSETFTCRTAVSGTTYTCTVNLTLYTTDVYESFNKKPGTLSSVASEVEKRLKAVTGYDLDKIVFDDLDLKGGDLFTDSDCSEEVYEDEYTASQFAKMYYVPNGSGKVSEIDYTVNISSSREISGTIYLSSDEFILLTAEIGNDETLDISSDDLLDAIYDWDDDFEVNYVKFSNIPNSTSDGYLYYEYDEDASNNAKVSTNTSYYVDPTGNQKELTDYTYVPGKSTSGVVTIEFRAYKTSTKYVDGIIQINVIQRADITITAAKNQEVTIDPDLFQDYLDEVTKSTKYDVAYVEISGAPRSKTDGYLYADGEKLTKSGDKTFYMDEDDVDVSKKKYDLNDLSFLGGSTNGTVSGTFKVYYYKTASAKNPTAAPEGTIDFVTGATSTNSLSGSIKASETMKFAASLSAFEDLGGNDNVYVTFTGLPTGGKLVYNWGTGSQEDVKVGTEYYLSYKAGKKLLSNVTFVPSYSSSKQARTISIPVKAYNSKEKAVTGTINITVNYAAYSSRFTDITTSTYADSVDFLYNQGITTGMTATTFGPNSNVTRAQFVTFLYRAAGQPAVTGVTNKFTDVKSTGTYAYAYNAILWAVQNNITTGRSATKFDPAANVTHQELLTFLYRYDVNYLGHPGTQGSLSGFIDASSLQSYAVAPAKWASYKGIIDGYTLQPAVAGSRATVALWLHRMLTL